jgi:hypothetical protein
MYLDEVTQKSWTDAEVLREINFSYQSLATKVMTTYEDYYVTYIALNMIPNQQYYGATDGVPTDIFKVRRFELNYDVTSNPKGFLKAFPVNFSLIRDELSNAGVGAQRNPRYFVTGFGASFQIGLIPVPDLASTGGIRLWYTPIIPNVTAQTDTFNIPYPDRYSGIIALEAAANLLRKGQQEEAVAARYIAEADAMKDTMMQELEDRISDEGRMIEDTQMMNTDFSLV